jgi:hypothetical protein
MRMIGRTHLRVGHGWTVQQYREAFHLPMHAPTCSRELSNVYREQAVERVKATDHFGEPPTPRTGPTPARSPRWRSLAELHPELVAELSPHNEGVDAAELGARPTSEALVALPKVRARVAGTFGRSRDRHPLPDMRTGSAADSGCLTAMDARRGATRIPDGRPRSATTVDVDAGLRA